MNKANGLLGKTMRFTSGVAGLLLASIGHAQSSRFCQADVGVGNSNASGGAVFTLPGGFAESQDGSPISAAVNQNFTGLDRSGATRTMNISGTLSASSQFGQLHSSATATVTNTYYNASNPIYDPPTNTGSPDSGISLGFADFTDTLQFGGALQAGYQARYLFHLDGTNSGVGAGADLVVNIAGTQFAFFEFNDGPHSETFATDDVPIDGTTMQQIMVQFSDQVVINTQDVADGSNVTGTANFSDTLTLTGIIVDDAAGNPVSGVTFSSASGTVYPTPEPATLSALMIAAPAAFRRRRR